MNCKVGGGTFRGVLAGQSARQCLRKIEGCKEVINVVTSDWRRGISGGNYVLVQLVLCGIAGSTFLTVLTSPSISNQEGNLVLSDESRPEWGNSDL